MKFNVKEWRKIYDTVHRKTQMLRNSRPTYDEYKKEIPPVCELSVDVQLSLEEDIKNLLEKNNVYLDACGMIPWEPLFVYDKDDPTTWASHESFQYQHLLKSLDKNSRSY